MNTRRLAKWWLRVALAIVLACVWQWRQGAPIETDLLALLPPTERNPVAEQAIDRLTRNMGARAVWLIGHDEADTARAAAGRFAQALRQSKAFTHVQAELPPWDMQSMVRPFFLPYRFHFLSDADRIALSKGEIDVAQRLQRTVLQPFQSGPGISLAEDPLGFFGQWFASLPLNEFKLAPEAGYLSVVSGSTTFVLVSAEVNGSPFDDAVQRRVVEAVSGAEREHLSKTSGFEVLRTGPVFYAESARAEAEQESKWIAQGSLIGIVVLMILAFRSLRPLILGLITVAIGICVASVVTVLVFGKIHILTLVFGASLIGEAIDYSLQYFAAHLGAGPDWQPQEGLRAVRPGLTIALGTSLLGYGALALAPFPALSQIALFAAVGLLFAYLSVLVLLPVYMVKPNKRDPQKVARLPRRWLAAWRQRMSPLVCLAVSAGLLILALPGWHLLKGGDDVRLLISRPAHLVAQEERIRALTGVTNGTQFFLVEGPNADAVLEREERLRIRLAPLIQQGALTGVQAVSAFVPSAKRQLENRKLLETKVFADLMYMRQTLEHAGLRDDAIAGYVSAFQNTQRGLFTVQTWLSSPMATPFKPLWLDKTAQGYASVVMPQGVRDVQVLRDAARGMPGVTVVDKAGSISELFSTYRKAGSWGLAGAVVLVWLLLLVRYGIRNAAAILAPAALALILVPACFGYTGVTFTFFHLMAMLLVLGVGVNYAIFLFEGGDRAPAALIGVILSALTTLLSFGLLGLSALPALQRFGGTLVLGITLAVLMAPMTLSWKKPQ